MGEDLCTKKEKGVNNGQLRLEPSASVAHASRLDQNNLYGPRCNEHMVVREKIDSIIHAYALIVVKIKLHTLFQLHRLPGGDLEYFGECIVWDWLRRTVCLPSSTILLTGIL